jgi:hypothetical protein
VKEGETIGLVGNTGNAKNTASHLHFGVYTNKGSVDPYPFVNKSIRSAVEVKSRKMDHYLKLVKINKTKEGMVLKPNTIVIPLAHTAKEFIVELPDGGRANIPLTSVKASTDKIGRNDLFASKDAKDDAKRKAF